MNKNYLANKCALVTGAGSGIGLATVRQLSAAGVTVAAVLLPDDPIGEENISRLVASGFPIFVVHGDVSSVKHVDAFVGEAIGRLGKLDILVNNAATAGTRKPLDFADLDAMTEEFWAKILSTNLVGPFRCSRAAAAALKRCNGAIVNTASVAGLGMRGSSIAYAASKAGLVNLTRNLARALAPEIRVNAVAPGLIDTPWTEAWSEDRKQKTRDATLLNRLGTAEEVADVIVFLATRAKYVNGETVVVNGGNAT